MKVNECNRDVHLAIFPFQRLRMYTKQLAAMVLPLQDSVAKFWTPQSISRLRKLLTAAIFALMLSG